MNKYLIGVIAFFITISVICIAVFEKGKNQGINITESKYIAIINQERIDNDIKDTKIKALNTQLATYIIQHDTNKQQIKVEYEIKYKDRIKYIQQHESENFNILSDFVGEIRLARMKRGN